jgi:hypothetical protein
VNPPRSPVAQAWALTGTSYQVVSLGGRDLVAPDLSGTDPHPTSGANLTARQVLPNAAGHLALAPRLAGQGGDPQGCESRDRRTGGERRDGLAHGSLLVGNFAKLISSWLG